MSTFNNFTTTVSFSDFSAENWDVLVKDGISAEYMPWDETEIQMLWNYIDQVFNGAINHYNGALTTTYNRIAALEAEVTCLWGELTRLSGGNIVSQLYYGPVVTYCMVYHYTKRAILARLLANEGPAIYVVLWTGILLYLHVTI